MRCKCVSHRRTHTHIGTHPSCTILSFDPRSFEHPLVTSVPRATWLRRRLQSKSSREALTMGIREYTAVALDYSRAVCTQLNFTLSWKPETFGCVLCFFRYIDESFYGFVNDERERERLSARYIQSV